MSPPFFIVGASRSGTTMLRLMMNAHSRLAVPDEMKYFRHVDGQYDLEAWQTSLPREDYLALARHYLDVQDAVFSEATEALEAALLATEDRTLRGPYQALLSYWARAQGKARWGEKTPHNIFYVDVMAEMFPEAQFIHVVRDPRAVVRSMGASAYYSDEPVFNALNWRMSVRTGRRFFQEHLRPEQRHTVRYEDLVRDPESVLRSTCAFLGESFEPGMLRFYETADQDMAHEIRTPSITNPVHEKGLTKWRERLSAAEVGLSEVLCREEMNTFGYERTTMGRFVSPLVLLKWLYWHWKVWQHRDRRGFEVEFAFLSGLRARAERWKHWVVDLLPTSSPNRAG